jgi:hypothetical protein
MTASALSIVIFGVFLKDVAEISWGEDLGVKGAVLWRSS